MRCVTLLMALFISGPLTGCQKFSQDVETIETSSIGGGSGGSGSGSSDDDGGEDYTDDYGADYYLGTPSNETSAITGLFLGDKKTWGYGSHETLLEAHAAENANFETPIASRDTNARNQWRLGWTGKDVKIGVVDEFNSNEILDTHGDQVSLVVNSVAPEAQLTTYNFSLTQQAAEDAFQNLNTQEVYIINNSWAPRVLAIQPAKKIQISTPMSAIGFRCDIKSLALIAMTKKCCLSSQRAIQANIAPTSEYKNAPSTPLSFTVNGPLVFRTVKHIYGSGL